MKNLLRWQYVVPRVLAILVALLAFQYTLCLIGRERVIRAVATTVGAKSELAAARVSFVDGRVTLGDLRIADPREPMRNLLTADLCDLSLDTGSYVRHGRLVGQGNVSGLKFLMPRETSGALAGTRADSKTVAVPFGENDSQAIADWMKQVDARFSGEGVTPLESLQLTADLAEQGAKEIEELERHIRSLEAQADQLREQASAAEANPLRSGDFSKNLPSQIAALRAQSAALLADLEKLPDRFEAGRRAIVAARVRDDRSLREQLVLNGAVAQPLAAYLMREQVSQFATEMIGWLRWTRSVMPASTRTVSDLKQSDGDGARAALRPSPELLLHTLALEGTASFGGKPTLLRGSCTDFTMQPWLLDRPIRLRLTSDGTPAVDLRSTIDRSGPVARDELLVDCKGLSLPAQELGRINGLRLSLGESMAMLNVSIQLQGEQLSGEIQVVQNGVQISPSVGSELGHVPLAATLQETLGDVHSLATRVTVRGTLAEPRVSLWSSIGPATAKAMDVALRRAADERATRVLADTQQHIDERLAQLDRQIADGQAELSPRVADSSDGLISLAGQHSAPGRLDANRLGRLPAGSLFK